MTRAFRCAVCGAGEFCHVWAPRPDGTGKETFLYECAGCSVVFLDVTAFNVNEPAPSKSRGARLPKGASKPPSIRTDDVSSSISASNNSPRDK
jgi:hypothetical protein